MAFHQFHLSCQIHLSFSLKTGQCDSTGSFFCNLHHKNIITGDLGIIKNKKLRKLITEGTNYWELWTINFSKALIETTTFLDTCINLCHLNLSIPPQTLNHGKRQF